MDAESIIFQVFDNPKYHDYDKGTKDYPPWIINDNVADVLNAVY